MKKFFAFLIMLMFVFSFTTVLATNATSNDEVIYLNSYEEYQELLQSMDGTDEAKSGYIRDMIEYIIHDVPTPTYKAKVISTSETKTEYIGDAIEGYNMYVYQDMTVLMLEGEYAGQEFTGCAYPIKVDSYFNIKIPKVNVGDIIYLCMYDDGETVYPYIQYIDSGITKVGFTFALLLVTITMILVYTGKHGAKILVPIVLLADLLFVVFADFVLNYIGVWTAIVGIILLTAIAFFALKLGVGSKFSTGMISLASILVVMTLLMYGFDAIANIAGISYEASHLVEKVAPVIIGNEITPAIDFHALSIGITVLLMAVVLIPIIVKTIETLENNNAESKEELKKYLAEKILFVVGILFVANIQKYMLVYMNVGRVEQLLNSEILTIEFARIMFVVIAMALSTTITELVSKFLED